MGGALARLSVLGEARSWALVGPIALRITALTVIAWLLHLVVHEVGHLLAAKRNHFQVDAVALGPLEWNARDRQWSWAGPRLSGHVSTLPIGLLHLRARLRRVAAAGPLATLAAVLLLGAALALSPNPTMTSPLGIATVTGALVLISALVPGRFREATAIAGSDLDQLLGGRRVLAHWTYLAVVQGVLEGRRLRDLVQPSDLDPLLPPPQVAPEPISLLAAVRHLEEGSLETARRLLASALPLAAEGPLWVRTDLFHQTGAVAALIDGDLPRAVDCLTQVRAQQSLPWYGDLLEACIAWASDDPAMTTLRLDRWLREAHAAPRGRLAFGGNEWILDRLRPDWRLPTPH